MEFIKYIIDLFLHLDQHLNELIIQYGTLTYVILFVVIFAETGFVFTPFLPGDSLLFAAGTFAALGSFNVHLLFFLLATAAVLGDRVVQHRTGAARYPLQDLEQDPVEHQPPHDPDGERDQHVQRMLAEIEDVAHGRSPSRDPGLVEGPTDQLLLHVPEPLAE